jgi:hypothetical protein
LRGVLNPEKSLARNHWCTLPTLDKEPQLLVGVTPE